MTKTAVGLFETSSVAEATAKELKVAGITQDNLRILSEPRRMPVTGVFSTPHTDFAAALHLDLRAMGATENEVRAYVDGVCQGGILIFATGTTEQVDRAAEIMNCHKAKAVEELANAKAILPGIDHENALSSLNESSQAGRIRYSGEGARIFVW